MQNREYDKMNEFNEQDPYLLIFFLLYIDINIYYI